MGNLRKFFFVVLVLAITVLCHAADRCKIFLSPLGGYSILRGDYIISYFDEGRLDMQAVERIAEYIGRYANSAREFPFWIDSENAWRKIRPFEMIPIKPDYEDFYIYVNDSYEWNWEKITTTYNGHGVKLWVSLFDHCGIRNNPWNPWVVAYGEKAFYSELAKDARHQFIDAFLRIRKGRVMGFELVNEPRLPLCTPEFLADTFVYLIKKGVQPEDIILGIQYDMKEKDPKYAKLYRDFRNLVVKELGKEWEQWLKSRCISPCHNMSLSNLKRMLGENPPKGGTRNELISQDGNRNPRPERNTVKAIVKYSLESQPQKARNGKLSYEVVYGKEKGDPLDSILGVLEAYQEFYGEYPENYKKYQERLMVWETVKSIFLYFIFWR
ncbi:MAG: hypothetical protein PVH61_13920 [Candidatus Aminicenantes bacterium]|jgi:hypothetical protein